MLKKSKHCFCSLFSKKTLLINTLKNIVLGGLCVYCGQLLVVIRSAEEQRKRTSN